MSSDRSSSCRWPLTILVGIVLAGTTIYVLLWLLPEPISVVSYLQVKSKPPIAVFTDTDQRLTAKDFEVFQQTQLALLKSSFVLNAALTEPKISQLDAVIKEEPEPLLWLQEELQVSFPGEGEILEVRYDGEEDPEEMKKIVDAVIDAYMRDVLYKERTQVSENRLQLAKLHQEVKRELREKLDDYEDLTNQLGGENATSTDVDINMLLTDLRLIQHEIAMAKVGMVDLEDTNRSIIERLTKLETNQEKLMERLKQHGARSPLLQMMKQEIEQQREIESSIAIRLQSWEIEANAAQDRIQLMSRATATIRINEAQRVSIAIAGGLAVFCLTCLGGAFMGCRANRQKRDTSDENC